MWMVWNRAAQAREFGQRALQSKCGPICTPRFPRDISEMFLKADLVMQMVQFIRGTNHLYTEKAQIVLLLDLLNYSAPQGFPSLLVSGTIVRDCISRELV
jgi:hypothetical protein